MKNWTKYIDAVSGGGWSSGGVGIGGIRLEGGGEAFFFCPDN